MQWQVEMSHSLQVPTSRGRRRLKGTLTKGQLTVSVRSGHTGAWGSGVEFFPYLRIL